VPELIKNLQTRPFKMPDDVSADMKDLLRSLLERNPDLRISWTEFFLHKCLSLHTLGQSSAAVGAQLSDSEQLLVKDHELGEVKKELEGLKAANDRMQQQMGAMERLVRESAQREKKLEEEKAVLMGELAKLKDSSNDTSSSSSKKKDGDNWLRLIAREQQISAELEAESKRWQETAEAKESELVQLRKELEQHRAREAERAEREAEWAEREAETKAETQMVYAEVRGLRSSLDGILEEKELHQKDAQQAKKQLEEANAGLAVLKQRLAQLIGEHEANARQEEAGRRKLSMMKEEMEALNAVAEMQFNEERKEKETLLRTYEETLKKKDEEIDQLKKMHADATTDLQVYKVALEEEMKEHRKESTFFNRRG
jgi:chromosome segregation ATPase